MPYFTGHARKGECCRMRNIRIDTLIMDRADITAYLCRLIHPDTKAKIFAAEVGEEETPAARTNHLKTIEGGGGCS